ncbi:hypothetical protein B0H12DRAFT_1121439 [Mycena haematopus]|nr:hypothetical protein B0H12DRAFT_1121439 [Mycena haematopus]
MNPAWPMLVPEGVDTEQSANFIVASESSLTNRTISGTSPRLRWSSRASGTKSNYCWGADADQNNIGGMGKGLGSCGDYSGEPSGSARTGAADRYRSHSLSNCGDQDSTTSRGGMQCRGFIGLMERDRTVKIRFEGYSYIVVMLGRRCAASCEKGADASC